MTGERCELCRFWPIQRRWSGEAQMWDGKRFYGLSGPGTDGTVSDCRRRAPVGPVEDYPDARLFGAASWPTTKREDWCGEFDARPPEPTPTSGGAT